MRKYFNLFALAAIVLGAWSCKTFKGAAVTCSPDPLEVHADSIKFTLKANVPPKSGMKKGGTYIGEGKIGGVTVGKVVFDSERYPKVKKTGIDTTISFQRKFESKMDGNGLQIDQMYQRKGKEFELPAIENLCQCCIITPYLIWENDQFVWSKHNYQVEVPVMLDAKFNFPKNVWEIQSGDYSKADIKAIGEAFKNKAIVDKIVIEGFASPEGPARRNVELSVNRSKVVKEWLVAQLKEAGYENYVDTTLFRIGVTSADWDGFKKGIQSQPYSEDVKRQIVTIVSSGVSEDQKEKQIMALVGGKDKVEFILAPLRRSTIRIEGKEKRRTNEEIDQIANDFVAGKLEGGLKDKFEKEEWLYAISRQTSTKFKRVLLEAFRDAYPADARAFNDLGVIASMQGDAEAAMDYLEKAEKLASNDYGVVNNVGVAYKNKGDYKKAKEKYEASLASKRSEEANFNLGVVLEKMARYSMAVEKFNAAPSIPGSKYNAGLCKLLMNDLNGAKADLGESIKAMQAGDNQDAHPYYVMAIVGARMNDAPVMSANLKKACDIDNAMREKARKDLEFRKFYSNSEFKAAVAP